MTENAHRKFLILNVLLHANIICHADTNALGNVGIVRLKATKVAQRNVRSGSSFKSTHVAPQNVRSGSSVVISAKRIVELDHPLPALKSNVSRSANTPGVHYSVQKSATSAKNLAATSVSILSAPSSALRHVTESHVTNLAKRNFNAIMNALVSVERSAHQYVEYANLITKFSKA